MLAPTNNQLPEKLFSFSLKTAKKTMKFQYYLRHPNQGIIYSSVPMRMKLTKNLQ